MKTFRIKLLGSDVTIRSDADPGYFAKLYSTLGKKIESTQEMLHVTDPLQTAILTGLFLVDDLLKEKKELEVYQQRQQETDRITFEIIKEIDRTLED